jgi:hypothetical protein
MIFQPCKSQAIKVKGNKQNMNYIKLKDSVQQRKKINRKDNLWKEIKYL